MEYNVLGKTGLHISKMGFGGIPIQKTGRESVRTLLHALGDMGINYIDTARGYTVSESFIGYGLQGIRDQFILATKSPAVTAQAMAADIEKSLSELQTDYIDLYQLHNPGKEALEAAIAPGGALEALKEAKAQGKIGHIGITLHSAELFEKALGFDWVETIMFPYNIVETQGETYIEECAKRNIGFICMKPLAGGAIENAGLAMRFLGQNKNISVVIPGITDPAQAEENAASYCNTAPLTGEEIRGIEKIREALGTDFCRRCNYCAPCTVGIPISAVFLMEGYLSRYGLTEWATKRYEGLPKHASDCIGCGACEERCPYHLPIRQKMWDAAAKFRK